VACEVNRGFDKEYHTVTTTDGKSYQAFKHSFQFVDSEPDQKPPEEKWYRTFKTRYPSKDAAIVAARHRNIDEFIVELIPNGSADLHVELKNVCGS
jgi:hypothetical protein